VPIQSAVKSRWGFVKEAAIEAYRCLDRLADWLSPGLLLVLLLGVPFGGFTWAFGPRWGVLAGVVAGGLVLAEGAFQVWRRADAEVKRLTPEEASVPRVLFDKPEIGASQPLHAASRSLGIGRIVRIPVYNVQGAPDAEALHGLMNISDANDQAVGSHKLRWMGREAAEISLSGNAHPVLLDAFVCLGDRDYFVWNDESQAAGVRTGDGRYRLPQEGACILRFEVQGKGVHVERTLYAQLGGLPDLTWIEVTRDRLHPARRFSVTQELQDALLAELVEIVKEGCGLRRDAMFGKNPGKTALWCEKAGGFLGAVFGEAERQRFHEADSIKERVDHVARLRDGADDWKALLVDQDGLRGAIAVRRSRTVAEAIREAG
jgi:hypothetical protein